MLDGESRQVGKECFADPVTTPLRSYIEVIQVEASFAKQRGKGGIVHGEPHRRVPSACQYDPGGGIIPEELPAESFFVGDNVKFLVFRKFPDEGEDDGDIFFRCLPDEKILVSLLV
jgi:hypothetical protein